MASSGQKRGPPHEEDVFPPGTVASEASELEALVRVLEEHVEADAQWFILLAPLSAHIRRVPEVTNMAQVPLHAQVKMLRLAVSNGRLTDAETPESVVMAFLGLLATLDARLQAHPRWVALRRTLDTPVDDYMSTRLAQARDEPVGVAVL